MSIARMMALAGARLVQKEHPAAWAAAGGDEKNAAPTVSSAMDKIAAFIPSEVIGLYVAGMGVISPTTDSAKWWIFGVCVGLIPIFMFLSHLGARKRGVPLPRSQILLLLFVFALLAFAAWASAMPATPFLTFGAKATQVGGFAVLILAAIMYKVADQLDIVPTPP